MKLLKEMIADEKSAPIAYKRLLKQLKFKEDRDTVRGIIRQERRHKAKLLRMVKRE